MLHGFAYCSTGYCPLNVLSITIISVMSCEMTFFILQATLRLAARFSLLTKEVYVPSVMSGVLC